MALGDLGPLEAEEAELEENIRRTDLLWQERAAATARLADLRRRQAEMAGQPVPTVADISEEVRGKSEGSAQGDTRIEILIAPHLDRPEVAKATSLRDAWKELKRIEEREKNAELSERIGRTFSAATHQLLQKDSLEWLKECSAEQFDVILTDPPYGMGADEFDDSGGKAAGAHFYEDSKNNWDDIMQVLRDELFRIAKSQAHLYFFCDLDNFVEARWHFSQGGWWVFRTPLIWYKPGASRAPWPEHGPQRKYEMILYAVKGKRPTLKLVGDVLQCNPDENLGHNAQKPVALFEELLKRSARPGDTVLDPFCGTGTIFLAAHSLKCRATGIEKDLAACGIAIRRLEALK